jgi:CRP/FNR family transcriptional regulator, cyclic AMP receptor protein
MISPEMLRRYALFAGLEFKALVDIAQICDEESVTDGTYLFVEDEPADKLYIVLEGVIDLLMRLDETGEKEIDIETSVVGDMLGWSALVEPHQYKLSGLAITDARVIAVDAEALKEYLASNPATGLTLMTRMAIILSKRLDNMHTRFVSMVD